MMPGNIVTISAFTSKANGLANVLESKVTVFQPIPGKIPKTESFLAIWDTGATSSVITPKVVANLGLIPSGKTNIHGVAGSKDNIDTYLISIILPNKVRFNGLRVAEVPQIAGRADILLGMDIISLGDFAVTNKDRKTVISFRFPSYKTIDFVEEINQEKRSKAKNTESGLQKKTLISAPMRNNKVDGNLPCPCGSGKKWKQCHGKK